MLLEEKKEHKTTDWLSPKGKYKLLAAQSCLFLSLLFHYSY